MDNTRISFASHKLIARGLAVYSEGRVGDISPAGDNKYRALVRGSQNNTYEVILDDTHLTKSTCSCPYCAGHQKRFCKHKLAVFFKLYPQEYEAYHNEALEEERIRNEAMLEYEARYNKMMAEARERVMKIISKMTPEEIKDELFDRMLREETEYEEKMLDEEYSDYDYYY